LEQLASHEKTKYHEKLRTKKEELKLKKGVSNNQSSSQLFKEEVKVEIKPYKGEADTINLNNWLQQLEVYIRIHNV
jgi:hypothetical protein